MALAVGAPRRTSHLPLLVVANLVLGLALLAGVGVWVAALAVVVPLCLAVAGRPQRGVLLLAALVPFHGLLLIVPAPTVVSGWKEALVLVTLAATVVAPPQARAPAGRRPPPWTLAVVGLVALGVLSAVVVGGLQAAVGMKTLFFYVLVTVAVWRCPLDAAERDRLVSVLMACGVITAVVGIAQQVVGGAVLNSLGYEYNSAIRTTGGMLRSFSTFNQPFGFGFFLMVVILVGLPVALADRGRRRNQAFLLALPVLGVALGFTFVRGAWIGVAVGLAYLGSTRQPALLLTIPLGLVALLLLPQELAAPALSSSSSVERVESWRERASQMADAPLGTGVGASGSASEKVAKLGGGDDRYQPDNYYFKVLLELGVLGLWLFLLLLGSLFFTARSAASRLGGRDGAFAGGVAATVVAVAVASLVATYLEIFPMDVYFWLFAGVVAACVAESR
jgi:putative inorganic carbon (HCO3(-)) transporter